MTRKVTVHHEPAEPHALHVKVGTSQLTELLLSSKKSSGKTAKKHHKKSANSWTKLFVKTRRRKLVSGVVLSSVFALLLCSAIFYSQTQRALSIALTQRSVGHPVDEKIKVSFSQAIASDVQIEITPKIDGQWKFHKNIFGVKAAEFTPQNSKLAAATNYTVEAVNAKRVLVGKSVASIKTSLETEFSPGVVSVLPKPGSKDVMVSKPLEIVFSEPRSDQNEPELLISPAVELEKKVSADKRRYSWKPKANLAQSGSYTAVVNKKGDANQKLVEIPFETVRQPSIAQATNRGYFYPEDKITVDFDIEMDTSKPAVVCQCEGEGKWVSPTQYSFQPRSITPGKSYGYVVPKDLKSTVGGVRETEAAYAIATPGPVRTTITGSSQAQLTTKLTLSFDQPVKRESVQPRLSMPPAVKSTFAWVSDTTATVTLSGLDYQTTYDVHVAPGIEPQKFGLTSNAGFSGRATTVAQTIKLPVPSYRQAFALSCEEASLRMALAYRGVQASDWDILQRVGYNPRPYDSASNSWDDPNVMFVGDVRGSQPRKTGYGVYAGPIAKAAQSYGRNATASRGVSANFLAQAIHDGNPVVIWGTTSGGARIDWNTPSGPVGAWVGQHARTLVGVVGKPAAPVGFYVNDPLGGQRYWSAGELMAHMNRYGTLTNQAVVVY